nr:uncharacterized protein LOC107435393 isoform X4 [Ziziphus jujuba var. spinosa]
MEFFHNGNAVRLRSHHQRYLFAKDDQETVGQDKDRSSNGTRWTVEFVTGFNSVIRLKSCYGKYLTASDQPLILEGLGSSMKVAQTRPSPVDSTIEWELIRVGQHIRLKSRHHSVDSFLRGSGRFRLYSVSHYPPQEHTTPAPQPSAPNRTPGSGQGDTIGKWQQGVETVGAIAGLVGAIADLVSNSRCG